MRRLEIIFVLFSLLVGCRSKPISPPAESLIERVEIAGCRETRRGPICEIEDNVEVVLWVETAPESSLRVEGVDASWTPVDGGWQTAFEVTTATTSINVVATRTGLDRYELPVLVWKRPARLIEANSKRSKSATTALAILDEIEPESDLRTRAEIATMRARIAQARGKYDEAIAFRQKSVVLGDEAGLISKPLLDLLATSYIDYALMQDFEAARSALEMARRRLPDAMGTEAAYLAYFDAGLARKVGDYRSAIRLGRLAARRARRLRDPWSRDALQVVADVLGLLGQHDDVAATYQKMLDSGGFADDPCASARFLGNRAWVSVLAREVDMAPAHDPVADALSAIETFTGRCPRPEHVASLLTTIALAEIQSRRIPEARRHIAAARAQPVPPESEGWVWLAEAEARANILEGKFEDALRGYEELESFAARTASSIAAWRAVVGRAFVRGQMGAALEALHDYDQAEVLLDTFSAVPFGGVEQALLVDERERVARRHAALLLRNKKTSEAVNVLNRHAQRSRRELQRGVGVANLRGDARLAWDRAATRYASLRTDLDDLDGGSWRLAASKSPKARRQRAQIEAQIADALSSALDVLGPVPGTPTASRPPMPNEAVLIVDRSATGWFVYGRTAEAAQLFEVGTLDPSASPNTLHDRLLGPFTKQFEGHKRLRIIARGAAERIDFHALPWGKKPLVASFVVTYGTDASVGETIADSRTVAVVVDDPSGNLPSARDEAAQATALLQRRFTVISLSGRDVTRRRLLEALNGARLLHWAGHGQPDKEVGFSAALPLGGRAKLDVGDILALPQVPANIVLSGCTTAPPDTKEIGPARAFVLAGASAVVATTRPVRDSDAKTITAALYQEPDLPLAVALQRVQTTLADSDTSIDWAAFFVLVP